MLVKEIWTQPADHHTGPRLLKTLHTEAPFRQIATQSPAGQRTEDRTRSPSLTVKNFLHPGRQPQKIIGLADGYRESTQSWRELLLDLQRRGLTHAPDLAIGDGALGFWHALREVFGATKEQRCWFHKTGNLLNAMPKSVQAKAKGHLHDIWQAETRVDAEAAFDFFVTTYGVKYDKAVGKLTKDRDVLLAFYDFPAEHWKHVRTTNPIESTFATVRHRTGKTKGSLSRKTGLAMAFKLMMSALTKWRKLDGANRMPEIIQGIEFKDGIKQLQNTA